AVKLDLADPVAVDEFTDSFIEELAAALGIDPSRIVVLDVQSGSVRVLFVIAEAEDAAEPSSADLAGDLADLVTADPDALAGLGPVLSIDTDAQVPGEVAGSRVNAAAMVSVDLDQADGNQALAGLEASGGESVALAVYVAGVSDVTGISFLVSFDATQVAFEAAAPGTGSELGLLATGTDAVPVYQPARVGTGTVQYGGSLVSPSAATAADGSGLLGVLRFATLSGYTGASLRLERVVLTALDGGRDTIAVRQRVLLSAPLDLMDQAKGELSFDFDPSDGDDELFHLGNVAAGEEVTADIYINDMASLTNYSITVLYDPSQLTYVTFSEGDFLGSAGGMALGLPPLLTETTIEFGSAILGPTAATAATGSGLVGRLTFVTTGTFTEADLLITAYSTKPYGGDQVDVESSIFGRVSSESIGPVADEPTPDFNGDGEVDFFDFFLFADAFGGTDPEFDLDASGSVDFFDFFIFADAFGQPAARLLSREPLPRKDGAVLLQTASGDAAEVVVDLLVTGAAFSGYGAVIEYDPAALRFISATDARSVLRAAGEALLLVRDEGDRVLLLGGRAGSGAVAEGLLAELRFAPTSPEAEGTVRVADALVRRHDGRVVQPRSLGSLSVQAVPAAFALLANYPNPFNPSTTIRYQLPAEASVRIDIHDALGQRVRALVAGRRAAGFHAAAWDGRNDAD
ncbi:MAG: hypothetical protein KJ957_08485, partial [Candidatus Omnitrophica bacterium]|nr:hypothetical protein [Candidatus Omnitrophota bacterium]